MVANAQILFSDSFETYVTGNYMVQQAAPSTWWTTWTNAPGGAEDARISELQAHSPIKSVLVDNGTSDIILKLGNKTSGKYNVSFYYYMPTGFGGYYNIQHYVAPGSYASEVYFGNNGTGEVVAQNITTPFTHAMDTWIFLENIIDFDKDSAYLFVDGVKIVQWKFSTVTSGAAGPASLGGIDFYAGSITGQTSKFYFDDVAFTQLITPLDPPTINVSTTSINTNGLAPESFTVTNDGQQDMTFTAYPTYPYSATNVALATSPTDLTYVASAPTSVLGGFTADVTVRSAVVFTPTKVNPSIGQTITSVFVGIGNDVPTNTALLIFERGSSITPGPGNLLVNKPFTATTAGELIEVILDSPLYIDGNDIWIGYTCDALATTYPLGLDGGPRVAGVNWISVGPGWSEMNLAVDNNFMIQGILQGSAIQQWLTVTPASGTIIPAQVQTIDLAFNITGLPAGNYLSTVVIGCNDPTTEFSEVDVNLSVVTSIENNNSIGIMTYPNPANNNFNIKSDSNIDLVTLYDINGKLVNSYKVNATSTQIDVNNLSKGTYLMKIQTGSNEITRNIVVE